MVAIAGIHVEPYALPFRQPLLTSRGRFEQRRGWLLCLADDQHRRGYGDAAPWPGFGAGWDAVSRSLSGLLGEHSPVMGKQVANTGEVGQLLSDLALPAETSYALELALLDLLGQSTETTVAGLLSSAPIADARSHHLLGEGEPGDAQCVKVKVGGRSLSEDVERVRALRARVGYGVSIRLDAGGAWDFETACRAVEALEGFEPEWLEQPLPADALEELAALRQRTWIPIALDESITSADRLDAAIELGAADVVVIKPMYVGGLMAAQSLVARATAAGLEAILTNALESAVGRAGVIHLAASTPGTHGLGGYLSRDLALAPRVRNDRIRIPSGSGLGVMPRSTDPTATPNPIGSTALSRPEHVVLSVGTRTWTGIELLEAVLRRAGGFAADGVTAGSIVALAGKPTADWVVAYHALGWLGATVALIPSRASDEERETLVAACDADRVVDSDATLPVGAPVPERFWPLEEARTIVFTSGTTGDPKPVALTTAQMLFSAFGSAIRLGHQPSDRWLCCLPLHRVGGLSIVMRCAFYGTTVVLEPTFDAEATNRAIDAGQVTLVSLVPRMMADLLDERADRPFPPSLRALLLGGAPAGDALLSRCQAIGAPVAVTWGMTEAASQIATGFPGTPFVAGLSLPPLPFARVDAPGGRLRVRGPVVGRDHLTGDLGEISGRGVRVAGRADATLISGGVNIAPARIERILSDHPNVRDVMVVGVPDTRWGERPLAFVVADAVSDDALSAWARDRLAPYEVPDRFVRVGAIPTNDMGKPCRRSALDALAAIENET